MKTIIQHTLAAALLISMLHGCGDPPTQKQPTLKTPSVELVGSQPDNDTAADDSDDRPNNDHQKNDVTQPSMDAIRSSVDAQMVQAFQLPDQIEVPPEAVLNAARLNLFETKSTKIVTDLSEQEIGDLLAHTDQIWPALQDVFGPIRSEVPVDVVPLTAFVVSNSDSFSQAGLFQQLPTTIHGRHNGWQFWIRWPSSSYYQSHLFAHEAAHCYTLITRPDLPAGWKESIAEWFATYRLGDGEMRFGAIPNSTTDVPGWGRIELLQQDIANGRTYAAHDVAGFESSRFQGVPTAYAWVWALSALMNAVEPEQFRVLIRETTSGNCSADDVLNAADRLDQSGLWDWWVNSLCYGIDPAMAAPRINPNPNKIDSRAGWQGVGVVLKKGERVAINAQGQVVLDNRRRPWQATPNGIRADYAGGHPIGKLLACTLLDGNWSQPQAIGTNATFTSPAGGELFLRVNDHWNNLANNKGSFRIEVTDSPSD